MAEYSDSQLRELLDAAATAEGEAQLSELMDSSPELRDRIERLSGVSDFATDFGSPGPTDEPLAENPGAVREIIAKVLTETPTVASASQTRVPSDSIILDQLEPHEDAAKLGRLGNHEIEEIIAVGGMGVVFRGRDPELDRSVAIKMLSPTFALAEGAKQRFHREAKAAAAIEHPNVIPIYSVERSEGSLPFLAMRYIDGRSLGELIADYGGKPLPMPDLLRIAEGVAAGLEAAHQRELIHRDIKPSNIMLERDGPGVWLTDFGLARAASDSGATQPNTFLGTPEFSSPEQIQGHDTDHRSDLFSFGSVLYLMATGRQAFSGADFASLVYQIVHAPHTPAAEANPALPGWLAELIDRLLAKDPDERFASAEEVRRCFEAASLGHVPSAPAHAFPTKMIVVASCVLAAMTCGVWFFAMNRGAGDGDRAGSPGLSDSPFTLVSDNSSRKVENLDAAIAAAESGDTIELSHMDRLVVAGAIEIPSGKSLTIRAAPGYRPILVSESDGAMLFTQSPLILEGVTFEQTSPNLGVDSAVLRSMGATISMANCRFVRAPSQRRMAKGPGGMGPVFIALVDLVDCQITNCEFYAPDSSCLRIVTDPARKCSVGIENSSFIGMCAFQLRNEAAVDTSIELRRSIVLGRSVLGLQFRAASESACLISASGNVLRGRSFCYLSNGLDIDALVRAVHWDGTGNAYDIWGRFVTGPGMRGIPTPQQATDLNWIEEDPDGVVTSLALESRIGFREYHELVGISPSDFALEKSEVEHPEEFGPRAEFLGPGAAYDNWRKTEAYRLWSERAQAGE